jgi:hypothetical protein
MVLLHAMARFFLKDHPNVGVGSQTGNFDRRKDLGLLRYAPAVANEAPTFQAVLDAGKGAVVLNECGSWRPDGAISRQNEGAAPAGGIFQRCWV